MALEPYFLDPRLSEQLWSTGCDNWGLDITGIHGTSHLPPYAQIGGKGIGSAVTASLMFWANPELGVLLMYDKFGGGFGETYFSTGDLSRLKEWVRTLYDDLRPVGLYIPLAQAWPAVKQFIESDGDLPTAIGWIKAENLPRGTFPDPWDHPEVK